MVYFYGKTNETYNARPPTLTENGISKYVKVLTLKNNSMLKKSLLILFLGILLKGCEERDFFINDINYPTTINKIPADELSQLQSEYFQRNEYIVTSLNQFGFCAHGYRVVEPPPVLDPLSEMEADALIRNFISINQSCVGVNNINEITYSRLDSSHNSSNTFWDINTPNQRIDTIEVLDTKIVFKIQNREVRRCVGNWYPVVYIPKVFNFNSKKAKLFLVNKVVSHYDFGGEEYEVTITPECLNESSVRLVICPIKTDDKIEVRVSWEFNIPSPVYYLIYIDVMTGEIIKKEPTIIS